MVLMINEGAPYWEIRDERNIYIQIEPIKVDAAKRTWKRRNMDYSFCRTFEVHLKFMKSTFKSANESLYSSCVILFCKVSHFWCDLNYPLHTPFPHFHTTFYKNSTSNSGLLIHGSTLNNWWWSDLSQTILFFIQSTNLPILIGCVNIKRKKLKINGFRRANLLMFMTIFLVCGLAVKSTTRTKISCSSRILLREMLMDYYDYTRLVSE